MKVWALLITGMPNCGKSTIAYHLVQNKLRNTLVIDGDKHRQMQFLGTQLTFSREDIMRNTEHVVKMARFAQDQDMNVLIPQITPYLEQRELMRSELDNFVEVYCDCPLEVRASRPNFRDSELVYEPSPNPDLIVNTSELLVGECVVEIMKLLQDSKLM